MNATTEGREEEEAYHPPRASLPLFLRSALDHFFISRKAPPKRGREEQHHPREGEEGSTIQRRRRRWWVPLRGSIGSTPTLDETEDTAGGCIVVFIVGGSVEEGRGWSG